MKFEDLNNLSNLENIVENIQNSVQELIGQFLMVKPVLSRLRNIATTKKEYSQFLPQIILLQGKTDTLQPVLDAVLDGINKLKRGLGGQVNIITFIQTATKFINEGNKLISDTSKLQELIEKTTKLKPVPILTPIGLLLGGVGIGFFLKSLFEKK